MRKNNHASFSRRRRNRYVASRKARYSNLKLEDRAAFGPERRVVLVNDIESSQRKEEDNDD